jgi:uncharacterized membrane protein
MDAIQPQIPGKKFNKMIDYKSSTTGTNALQNTTGGSTPVPSQSAAGTTPPPNNAGGTSSTPNPSATGTTTPPNNAGGTSSAPSQSATGATPPQNNVAGTSAAPNLSATGAGTPPKDAGDTISISKKKVKKSKNVGQTSQKVESVLKGIVKKIVKLPTNKFVWGLTGVLGASAAVYGIAKDGTTKGLRDARQEEGSFYKKLYDNTSSSTFYSHLLEDVKGETHQTLFDHWLFPAIAKVKHVTKSVALETVRNVDNIAASAAALGALFIKTDKIVNIDGIEKKIPATGNKIAKSILGTAGAGYLLFKGGYTFIRDVLGFGKT